MEKLNSKTKILVGLILIIIVAGIIITLVKGFKFDLRYEESEKIELYIGKDFEISDIKEITDETIPNQSILIQKVEVYEDSVSIIAKEITDEQKANLVNKVNEKYEIELSNDDIQIESIPHVKGIDIIKPYIAPFAISTVIILVYMSIRYYKLGLVKIILKTIGVSVLAQVVLLSIIAITRIQIGRLTMATVIAVYMLTLIGVTTMFEKERAEIKEKEA